MGKNCEEVLYCQHEHYLKEVQIEDINLVHDIYVGGDIDAAFLQAYRELSYKVTRF